MLAIIDILFLLLSFVSVYFLVLFFMIFVLERKNIRSMPEMKTLPFVSVIIPAYNKEKFISATIEAVKSLDYPKNLMEIIVVDDGSTDNTFNILKKTGGIKILRKENEGRAACTVNYGIKNAKGEIIACIDGDSVPEKDSLIKAVRFFEDKDVAGVTASVLAKNANNLMQKLQRIEYALLVLSRKLMEKLNAIYVTPGPMALYRKDVIMKLGGFDTKIMTEDIEIAWRLLSNGYKIRMSIDSKVYTDVPDTFGKWWHQRIRWNIGGAQTAVKYFGYFFKTPSNVGKFLLPMFTLSYALTLLGLAMFFYLVSAAAYNFVFVFLKSGLMGADMFRFSFHFVPDILVFLGGFTFVVSMLWLKFSLDALDSGISARNALPDFLIYIFFYIAISPFNLIVSTWKLLRKNYNW